MADEKKPFAEVEEFEGTLRVVVGGVEVDSELHYEDVWTAAMSTSRRERCAAINAAVEQREAKLRGALQRIAAIQPVRTDYPDHPAAWPVRFDCPMCGDVRAQTAEDVASASTSRHEADCPWAIARAALDGTGPEYVPTAEHEKLKAELAAMRKHIEGTWGVLLAELANNDWKATDIALGLCRELGIGTEINIKAVNVALRAVSSRYLLAIRDGRMWVVDTANGEERPTQTRAAPAHKDAQTTLSRMTEAIQRQHIEAVEQSLIELTASESLMLGHGTAERIYVPAPADGALARDILRSGRLEVEVVTRLVDGVARTTREQRVRPPQD